MSCLLAVFESQLLFESTAQDITRASRRIATLICFSVSHDQLEFKSNLEMMQSTSKERDISRQRASERKAGGKHSS